tara:strand:- start:81 stop:665 length:585 start_codon:yes stop_codon:yes gene_type:complete
MNEKKGKDKEVKMESESLKERFSEAEIRELIKGYGSDFLSPREKIRILYLDDEIDELESFQSLYRRVFTVFIASTPEKAREIIEKENLHIILTDQRMEPMTGVEFLKSIIADYPDPVRILVTGYADMNAVIDSINMGQVYKYIAKPYPREAMQKAIENAGELFFLRRDRKELIQKLTRSCSQLEFLLRQTSLDI